MFVADDYINPLLTIGNGKEIENVRLSEVKEVLDKLYGASVQTQLPLARHNKRNPNTIIAIYDCVRICFIDHNY